MLNGIKNFLAFVNDNWTTIIVIVSLAVALIRKIQSYVAQSDDKKIKIAKDQIKESMLKMVSDAEIDYQMWNQAGSVKRSQVIQKIFADYPVLSKIVDQDALIEWIDDQIDASLGELRKIIADNNAE